jgi:hypothetical protein
MPLIHITMNQDYCINMGPFGFATEETCRMTVLRGYTRFEVRVEVTRVKGTSFGKELLQEMELRKGRPRGKANDQPLFDLIYQKCLPFLENLAPRTSLHDVSLEAFLHSPSYDLELTQEESDEDVRIVGEDKCLYMPAFFTSPMRITDLPGPCKAVPHFRARNIRIARTADEGKALDGIQGRVVTAEGVVL